jgi:AraC-like DNA-binding protein
VRIDPRPAKAYDFERPGFSVFTGHPTSHGHRHNEVEVVVFESAPITALYGGLRVEVPPDHLVVLWGAMPHQALVIPDRTVGYGIRLPLGWILSWKLPPDLVRRLTSLEVLISPRKEKLCSDLARMKEWIDLVRRGDAESAEIVLLEIHARLRRLARDLAQGRRRKAAGPRILPTRLGRFEEIAEFLSKNYLEPIRIPDIARAAGVSRTHAMRLFRRITGMSLLGYLLQQRLSNAQRLLATGDRKVAAIAAECGFGSTARFYAAFRKFIGMSPGKYRSSIGEAWRPRKARRRR